MTSRHGRQLLSIPIVDRKRRRTIFNFASIPFLPLINTVVRYHCSVSSVVFHIFHRYNFNRSFRFSAKPFVNYRVRLFSFALNFRSPAKVVNPSSSTIRISRTDPERKSTGALTTGNIIGSFCVQYLADLRSSHNQGTR